MSDEGRCTCTGEGLCEYCQRTAPASAQAELRDRLVEVMARVRRDNRIKGDPSTQSTPLLESDLTLELVLAVLVSLEDRVTTMERGLEDLRFEVLG